MRHEPTDAEKRLWRILRGRRLDGYKFRRQYPMDGYVLDFYCPQYGVCVEADGGQHNDQTAKEYDGRRTQRLAEHGVRVLRFSDYDILSSPDEVAQTIWNELQKMTPVFQKSLRTGNGPHPGPLPQVGEGTGCPPLPLAGEGKPSRRLCAGEGSKE